MAEIIALTIRRGQLKGQLTRFGSYIKDNKDNIDIEQLTHRREKMSVIWDDFEQVQTQIEEEKGINDESENYRAEFEELYFKNMAECDKLMKSVTTNSNNSDRTDDPSGIGNSSRSVTPSDNGHHAPTPIKLAALEIPKFSGNYTEWSSYYDIYMAIVHNNNSLSDIQRFFYLRSSLSGDAERSIQCLQTTSDNYQKAWASLIERYNNKRILVQVHTKALFDITPINEESSHQLRKLNDVLSGHIKALETLGQSPKQWGSLLVHLITTKLDTATLRHWESEAHKLDSVTAEQLLEYLQSRFRILEAVESAGKFVHTLKAIKEQSKHKKNTQRSTSFATSGEIKCYNCKQSHTIYKCPSFLKLSIIERIKRITELNLCKTCLRSHDGEKCNARPCPKCLRAHNGLLHIVPRNASADKTNNEMSSTSEGVVNKREINRDSANTAETTSVVAHTTRQDVNNQILLSTAVVLAYSNSNELVPCRVLLDSGSQNNFITESMSKRLQLKRRKISYSIIGINQSNHSASHQISTKIKSRLRNYETYLDFVVMPKLTSYLPSTSISASDINIPKGIDLADPSFNTSNKIDMIIGSEIFFELICADQIKLTYNGPTFQNTLFGWVVAGPISSSKERAQANDDVIALYCSTSPSLTSLEEQIAKFWRLEEIQCKTYSLDEKTCKNHFDENVKRANDGRFIVSLPFREAPILGKSYEIALRRFLSLERRFQTQPKLKEDYKKFMDEYIALGHMEVVTAEERSVYMKKNYLPHHAVTKESSSTTKLRVVFDASCKTDTGVSLNDTLYKGPSIQEELVCIMARFRTHKYVISADIVKMYRQIWIAQHHQDYQRILWRSSPDLPIQICRLKTITYGVLTASFLATGCLQKLAEEEHKNYANACRAIRQDFYMDDLLTGADTIENTLKLRNDIITVLKTAGLELRKWSSNMTELLRDVSKIDIVHGNSNCNSNNYEGKVTKLLGLFWNQENDSYQYMVESYNSTSRITKRNVLSEIASVFDPLGLISPIVVRLKLIIQKLWQLNINWDEVLPSEICCEWRKNRIDLEQINSLTINRFIINSGKVCNVQIHGFADASISAYGACLYLRTTNDNGNIKTSLICAKSRVAPLKVVTLPRLELLAALLLARLSAKYIPCLQLRIDETYYWTDSTIVLAWISSPSSRWKTFVGHRVSEIQELSSISQWKHVNTNENPADIVSRGCSSLQIIDSRLWWNGPEWLQAEKSDWPKTNCSLGEDNILEEKPVTKIIMSTTRDTSFLNKYSTLSKLVRVIAYCLRFKNNAKPNSKKVSGSLLFDELEYATTAIVKLVQSNAWYNELKCLAKSLPIKNNSPLIRLKPFLDENHVIRVGGRLKNSSTLDIFQRHPVVLPANSPFTRLIFSNEYDKSMHGGPQSILARIRLRYWPLNGRNIARAVVQRCVKCFKYKPIVVQPIMGDLPKDRVEPARAFAKCGVDFAGPVYVKSSLRRKAATNKAYICVWVCFVTKAIHIELVGDLTTEAFLNALNRFFDRRGVCSDIYSDNATNFVGANRHLQELKQLFLSVDHQNKMQIALNKIGVNWHFIPPRSPHFGGLWEASVKSVKSHLYKTLGNAALTYEELYTVLVRVEAILNSRPLTPISTDPTDLTVLTPSHFLIGDNLSALPERDVSTTPPNRLTRWKRVTQLTQQLWRRWKHEYLNQLQVRDKWCHSKGPSLSTNTIVLLRDDKHPPLHWKIGRVIETHKDSDGVIRVATVRTNEGVFKRAVRILCPLPFEGNVKLA